MNEDVRKLLEAAWADGEGAGHVNSKLAEWPNIPKVENPFRREYERDVIGADGLLIIGPDCFTDVCETVIEWKGRNYILEDGPGHVTLRGGAS